MFQSLCRYEVVVIGNSRALEVTNEDGKRRYLREVVMITCWYDY
jgi:hypothetical protein